MNKNYALLLTAVLSMATAQAQTTQAAQTPVQSAAEATPSNAEGSISLVDSQLSTARVSIEVGNYTGPLSSLLAALAKSAGYGIILETDVDTQVNNVSGVAGTTNAAGNAASTVRPIVYSFRNTPFNEVWPLVMDVAGLSYEVVQVGGRPVLRVSNKPVQAIIKLQYINADYARQKALQFFGEAIFSDNPQKDASGNVVGYNRVTTGYEIPSKTFKLVADTAGDALIVGGTSAEVNSARNFIRSIDTASNAGATVTPQAPAIVQSIYTVKGNAADISPVLAAQFPNLKVTPVGQTGQLVLSGVQRDIDAVQALLSQIDRAPAGTGASAAPAQQVYSAKGDAEALVTFLNAQYPTLRVIPVGTTGQLLLSGTQAQLDTALALLGQVDRTPQPQTQTVQRIFQLVNASAEELKATLENTLARDITPTGLVPNPVALDANGVPVTTPVTPVTAAAPATTAAGTATTTTVATTTATNAAGPAQATIIADARTNTLVVRGTQTQVDQIAELIPQLDRPVPQINVQVRIQEITESAGRTLGLNWRANFGNFTVSAGNAGLRALFDPTQAFAGFNIFPTLTALESQGLTKKVYDGSVTMQSGQRSLGTGSATQNASGAAAASIKSGGKLEINIPSSAANVPPIQKTVDYGVILDFFNPQVAPDGTITMRVRGQVNDLATADVSATLQRFTNSEAQSTVTFKSGETVLMSGLMGTKESTTKNGLPFLTSTPFNALAGRTVTDKSETQLLVVITGTIVK